MTKIKHKDRILKAAIEKQQLTYKGHVYNSHKADFSAQREDIREEIAKYSTIHFKRWKRKKKSITKNGSTQWVSHSDLMERSKVL